MPRTIQIGAARELCADCIDRFHSLPTTDVIHSVHIDNDNMTIHYVLAALSHEWYQGVLYCVL